MFSCSQQIFLIIERVKIFEFVVSRQSDGNPINPSAVGCVKNLIIFGYGRIQRRYPFALGRLHVEMVYIAESEIVGNTVSFVLSTEYLEFIFIPGHFTADQKTLTDRIKLWIECGCKISLLWNFSVKFHSEGHTVILDQF